MNHDTVASVNAEHDGGYTSRSATMKAVTKFAHAGPSDGSLIGGVGGATMNHTTFTLIKIWHYNY